MKSEYGRWAAERSAVSRRKARQRAEARQDRLIHWGYDLALLIAGLILLSVALTAHG
jgi:hypothetical protein